MTPTGELSGSVASFWMARDSGALTPNKSCYWLPWAGNDSSLLHAVNEAVHAANIRESKVPFDNLEAGLWDFPSFTKKYLHNFVMM